MLQRFIFRRDIGKNNKRATDGVPIYVQERLDERAAKRVMIAYIYKSRISSMTLYTLKAFINRKNGYFNIEFVFYRNRKIQNYLYNLVPNIIKVCYTNKANFPPPPYDSFASSYDSMSQLCWILKIFTVIYPHQ